VITKEGPTGLITTTTAPKLHPENETRLLSLGVIDTQEQTQAVMLALAVSGSGCERTLDYSRWHALQDWLANGERRVAVPFALELAKLVPPVAVRLRRDFKLLLTLISAHALLHRGQREHDEQGRITATLNDYAAVRELVEKLFSEGLEATVSATMRATVEAVATIGASTGKTEISLAELARHLKLDKNPTHHRVRKAIARGFLVNNETKRGLPARIAIGDPLPGVMEILPQPKALEDRCSVVVQTEGIIREGAPKEGDEHSSPYLPPDCHYNTTTPPVCAHCGSNAGTLLRVGLPHGEVRLHRECIDRYAAASMDPEAAGIEPPAGHVACQVWLREIPRTSDDPKGLQ
jgi:hypothetical protein